ncbi:MAG TPA: hypothetical protein VGK73_07040 [Polyangiaceae bacterium]
MGRPLVRFPLLTLVASLSLYGGACSSDAEAPPASPHEGIDIEDVVYLGDTNDEGLEVLLGEALKAGPAPVVTAPEEAAVLEAKTTFTYEKGTTARLERVRTNARGRSFSFADLFAAERVAHAHGEPMNGDAYLLTFASAGDPELLRVFTDETSYEPEDDAWSLLAEAGELTLTVRMGTFEEGRLTSGGGPVESAPLHFSINEP